MARSLLVAPVADVGIGAGGRPAMVNQAHELPG